MVNMKLKARLLELVQNWNNKPYSWLKKLGFFGKTDDCQRFQTAV